MALWRDVPQKLAERTGWGVCAYSRQGYGRSDPNDLPLPLDYMTVEATQVLPQVLDYIAPKTCVLVGHSDGATIAALHAALCPAPSLKGTCLIAPHFFTEQIGLNAIRAAREAYQAGDLKQRLSLYHAHVDCAFRGWNDSWLHPDFVNWRVDQHIRAISQPILAVQGRDDAYGTLRQIDVISDLACVDVQRLVIDGVGHAPLSEAFDQSCGALSDFLQNIEI